MGYKEILQKKQAEAANSNNLEKESLSRAERDGDTPKDFKFYGVVSPREYLFAIDFRLSNGDSTGLLYSDITGRIHYSRSDGIKIKTTNELISIEGRNLQMLYNYLLAARVKYIQANVGNDLSGDKDLFVKGIKIEDI